jgi:uncharacterized RDD family membrane protein YckC
MVTPEPSSDFTRPDPVVDPEPVGAPVAARPESAPVARPDTFKRILAKFLDAIFAAIIFWVAYLIVPGAFFASLVAAIVAGAYLLVKDGLDLDLMRRQSLGKRIVGLSVVRLDGSPMDVEASVRRNWMFAIGYLTQAAAFGWGVLATLISLAALALVIYELFRLITATDGRRWGDELAHTQVINT